MLPNLKLKAPNSKIKIKRVFKLIKIIFFSKFDEIFFTKKISIFALEEKYKNNTRTNL